MPLAQYDEANTPVQARLTIKTGGGNAGGGNGSGIHWHMNLGNEVTYIAKDPQHQQIPWVRVKDRTGRITEYVAAGTTFTPARRRSGEMDCIDCHSRPAHIYVAPDRSVDRALSAGMLDRSLPSIKSEAVTVLAKDYATNSAALHQIGNDIRSYYQKSHPDIAQSKKQSIEQAVVAVRDIFARTRFPEMRVDWRTHPDNAGHLYSSGCFRCHDDQHVARTENGSARTAKPVTPFQVVESLYIRSTLAIFEVRTAPTVTPARVCSCSRVRRRY